VLEREREREREGGREREGEKEEKEREVEVRERERGQERRREMKRTFWRKKLFCIKLKVGWQQMLARIKRLASDERQKYF
jgi:hypothetical protein